MKSAFGLFFTEDKDQCLLISVVHILILYTLLSQLECASPGLSSGAVKLSFPKLRKIEMLLPPYVKFQELGLTFVSTKTIHSDAQFRNFQNQLKTFSFQFSYPLHIIFICVFIITEFPWPKEQLGKTLICYLH